MTIGGLRTSFGGAPRAVPSGSPPANDVGTGRMSDARAAHRTAASGTGGTRAGARRRPARRRIRWPCSGRASYIQLLVLAAVIGRPGLGRRLRLPQAGQPPPELALHLAAQGARVRRHAGVVAASAPGPGRRAGGGYHQPTCRARPGTSRPRGSKPAGRPRRSSCPGVILASLATLSLGVVLGPEAPLIAIGGGLGVLAVQLATGTPRPPRPS